MRELLPEDLISIVYLDKIALGKKAWSRRKLRDTLTKTDVNGYGFFENGTLLGFVIYEIYTISNKIKILKLVVGTKHRRRSIGTIMFCRIMDIQKSQGIRDLLIPIDHKNLGAQMFLKALGIRCVYGGCTSTYTFRNRLSTLWVNS